MNERCQDCPAPPGCLVFSLFGEAGCEGHKAERKRAGSLPKPPPNELPEETRLAEERWLIKHEPGYAAAAECPHRQPVPPGVPKECTCWGVCGLGLGDLPEGRVSRGHCRKCPERTKAKSQ